MGHIVLTWSDADRARCGDILNLITEKYKQDVFVNREMRKGCVRERERERERDR